MYQMIVEQVFFLAIIGGIFLKKIDEFEEIKELESDIEIIEEFVDISDSLIELEQDRDSGRQGAYELRRSSGRSVAMAVSNTMLRPRGDTKPFRAEMHRFSGMCSYGSFPYVPSSQTEMHCASILHNAAIAVLPQNRARTRPLFPRGYELSD